MTITHEPPALVEELTDAEWINKLAEMGGDEFDEEVYEALKNKQEHPEDWVIFQHEELISRAISALQVAKGRILDQIAENTDNPGSRPQGWKHKASAAAHFYGRQINDLQFIRHRQSKGRRAERRASRLTQLEIWRTSILPVVEELSLKLLENDPHALDGALMPLDNPDEGEEVTTILQWLQWRKEKRDARAEEAAL